MILFTCGMLSKASVSLQMLDRRLLAAEAGGVQALGSLDSQLAEVEDVISYCSDALSIGRLTLLAN